MQRAASLLTLAFVLSACGSRSALLERNASPSTGGSGGSVAGSGGSVAGSGGSTGGSGGVGGGSGGSAACDGLFPFGDVLAVEHPTKFTDESPQLAISSDDGEQLTVVFTRRLAQGYVGPEIPTLRHATLSPWQSWPSGIVSPTFTTFKKPEYNSTFAVGGSFENHFAASATHGGSPGFAPRVDPHSQFTGPYLDMKNVGNPLFVSAGGSGLHFLADSNGQTMWGQIWGPDGSSKFSSIDFALACGLGVAAADAVPYQDGWIVALANEPTAPPTAPPVGCSNEANGASRLDVLRVSPKGKVEPLFSIDAGAPIIQIATAPHPQGAWVVWRIASGGIVTPIQWLRFDAESSSAIGPGDVSDPGDLPRDGFDAAALENRLAVVWGNDPTPDLTVSVIEEAGGKSSQAVIEPGFFGPPSIAASPAGNSVVVAWHMAPLSDGNQVNLARFDCHKGL